ncbi:fluoride efflux transporter CrcB [Paraferrimonas sp. SM1919]|uniref:fluoride efflux transporter CrcB n=1 Tax=Paraferrimonas sp. SM1919 TaxID=2662263 RepID=UPI0013D0C3F5|nr:fluoride efflux transporter CrcB [Paraferrimonas sp. SM1919]
MTNLLCVAVGGAIGASFRYFTSLIAISWFGTGFAFGTLAVNSIGSFLMGILWGWSQVSELTEPWRLFIGVGLLGAFTTFSTFSIETLLMFQQGQWLQAGFNILLNLVICLVAVYLGQQLILSRV